MYVKEKLAFFEKPERFILLIVRFVQGKKRIVLTYCQRLCKKTALLDDSGSFKHMSERLRGKCDLPGRMDNQ